MRPPTRMNKSKEDNVSGAASSGALASEKPPIKGKTAGSGPNATTRGNKKKTKETRLRQLLLPFAGTSPTILETTKAKRIVDLEEELKTCMPKAADEYEKELKEALIDLREELGKRSKKGPRPGTGSNNAILLDNEEEAEDMKMEDLTGSIAGAFVGDNFPPRNQINGKDWVELSASDDELMEVAFTSEIASQTENKDGNNERWKVVEKKNSNKPKLSPTQPKKKPLQKEKLPHKEKSPQKEKPSQKVNQKPSGRASNPYKFPQKDVTKAPKETPKAKPSSLKQKTMKDALAGESEGVRAKGKYTFRLRGAYLTEQDDAIELTLYCEKQRILNEFAKQMKAVDPDARIVSWKSTGSPDFVGHNLERLSPHAAEKYVGMPNSKRILGRARNKMGFRINSNLTMDQFIDTWGKYRKEPGWVYITPAEMQESPTAFAVGACQGSSPNMVTELINQKLKSVLGVETGVEVSFQQIDRKDMGHKVISEFWNSANEKAESETPSGVSKNRTKNLYSPAALVVYVSDLQCKKDVKRLMMQHFGSGKTAQDWAKWPDGSMMRFMPFIPPTSNLTNLKKIKDMMSFQIYTKATETVRDIEVHDIFSVKEYLKGKTFQEAILNIESDVHKGIPAFKHVIKRWTFNPLETRYALTSYGSLSKEADKKALALMDILHNEYGNGVLQHFGRGASIIESHHHNRKEDNGEEPDPELEAMLMQTSINTDSILEPGFISLLESEDVGLQGGSTIDLSLVDTKMETAEVKSDSGEISKLSGDASLLTYVNDDETIVTGSTNNSSVSKTTRNWKRDKMFSDKLEEIDASMEDVDAWKEANPDGLELLKSVSNGSKTKLVLSIIRILRDVKKAVEIKSPQREKEQSQIAPKGS